MAPSQAIQAHLHRIGQALLYRKIQALLYRKIQALLCKIIQALLYRKIQEIEQALPYRSKTRFSYPRLRCKTEVSLKVTEDCHCWSESVAKPSLLFYLMVCNVVPTALKSRELKPNRTRLTTNFYLESTLQQSTFSCIDEVFGINF